ncbi:unnamed protein product, partial [Effrenium voratum]
MQYDGRVSGWPGARLNLRMMRSAHVYTRAPGQSIWDVLGAVGGFSGLMMSVIAFSVHALERFEDDPATSAGLEDPSGTIEEEKEGFPTDATISGMAGLDACLIFSFLMLLSIVSAVGYGIGRHFLLKYRKQFRFFLCHQKVAAGSMARLLKMELQKRGSRFATFVDCDDLNDLTKLFSYVGQDTETFVIMGSPDILTRKWCVGEMCTARSHKVHTVLLAWPEFMKPDKMFIENYESIVPDITELANYNIGMQEVADTMRWINTIECVDVPHLISTESIDTIVSSMTGTVRTRSMNADARTTPDCLILADLDNMEAAATAYVLLGLIVQKLMGGQKNNMPAVLQKDKAVPSTAVSALVICSDGCFKSFQFAERLLAVARMSGCCVLPIIAEDGFRFPAQTYYEEIETLSQLQSLDIKTYIRAIKAVFQEIAVVFSPQPLGR